MRRLVLHFCCGPCGVGAVERLARQFSLICYFYNPNIWPEEEYMRRLEAARIAGEAMKIEIVPGPYKTRAFEEKVKGLQDEKEGGKRCLICYRIRLEGTAIFAKERGIDIFTTTLSISPHKDANVINAIGAEVAKTYGLIFYEVDLKKDGGFEKSTALSKKLGLYRQRYCGCRYGLWLLRR